MQTLWNSSQNAPEMAQPTFSDENIIELEIHDTNIIQKVLRWTRWSGNQVGALKWWGLEIASVENEMGGWLGIPSRVDRWCGGPRCGWRSILCISLAGLCSCGPLPSSAFELPEPLSWSPEPWDHHFLFFTVCLPSQTADSHESQNCTMFNSVSSEISR